MHLRGLVEQHLLWPLADSTFRVAPFLCDTRQPWSQLNLSGKGDFIALGDENADALQDLAGLRPGHDVLEVGCGIGRNATALKRRLGDGIRYVGFDIVRFAITWCRQHFRNHPNFRFEHSNIYNSMYNYKGLGSAVTYEFPSPSSNTDIVFAMSVFTHMPADEVAHYLRESARVLRAGGRLLFSCYRLDGEAEASISSGRSVFSFAHEDGERRVDLPDFPDAAVGFTATWFDQKLSEAGLELVDFRPGNWRGNEARQFQDFVVVASV